MAVQNKVLYAFRGWIAFVAFMDLGTAGRSYIEGRSFLNNNGETEHLDGNTLFIYWSYIQFTYNTQIFIDERYSLQNKYLITLTHKLH